MSSPASFSTGPTGTAGSTGLGVGTGSSVGTGSGVGRAAPAGASAGGGAVSAAALVGLRRVDWVRLLVDDDRVGAEAVGVGFRLPTTCPISLSVAARLISSGVPHVTRHLGTRG
jgi:hypothetical protein